jgi:hypothetical protein
MDIVYPFKESTRNDSEELRYSLRSLKNIPHDNVIIVGEKPSWIKNVTYIEVPQSKTKAENSLANIRAAASSPLVSDEFILMNDDFFILKPIDSVPTLHAGPMKDFLEWFDVNFPEGSVYISAMKALYSEFQKQGIESPLSYGIHVPMVFNKSKLSEIYGQGESRMYQYRSYYGNLAAVGGERAEDVKIFFEPDLNPQLYKENPLAYFEQQSFLSVNVNSFKNGLPGDYVRQAFPEKSQYEI